MSHQQGEVRSSDGAVLGYFEYNGTADIACTAVWPDAKALWEHWRKPEQFRTCSCAAPQRAPVVLWANYGSGIEWPSEACLECMTITGETDPYAETTQRASSTATEGER